MSEDPDFKILRQHIRDEYNEFFTIKDADGKELHPVFNTLPTKKELPEYYAVIKTPISFNTLKKRVPHYTDAQYFINDIFQIPWNAKTYNTKDSVFYVDANILQKHLMEVCFPRLKKIYPHLEIPYLGPLPDEKPLPDKEITPIIPIGKRATTFKQAVINLKKAEEEAAVKEVNEEENLEYEKENGSDADTGNNNPEGSSNFKSERDDDYIDTSRRRSSRRVTRNKSSIYSEPGSPTPPLNHHEIKTERKKYVKRGRPPIIDFPYIQRMKNVLKLLRKENDVTGRPLVAYFERNSQLDSSNAILSKTIWLDDIRTKVLTRTYKNFKEFQDDFSIMISTYKSLFKDESERIKTAMRLETKFDKWCKHELAKPDRSFLPEGETRVPIGEVDVKGINYKVGDWVLIRNPAEGVKPTVGEIFKIWKTEDGKTWINCCWYFRPEQTVHRVDRLFYKNEVMKTGQYRDHLADELVGKGYVIHFTRFQRGDIAKKIDGPLFVCEFRYNENDKVFNKIRTWKACLPEEIRNIDDSTIPVNGRKFFKYPSPLKDKLPPNATINDPIPQPTEGAPNAPPLIGAVYLRPKLEKDDLGEYSTSSECPRYIIRPGDPHEQGKIDFATGTIIVSGYPSASSYGKTTSSSTRLPTLRQQSASPSFKSPIPSFNQINSRGNSMSPITAQNNALNINSDHTSTLSNLPLTGLTNRAGALTADVLKQHQLQKQFQQQQLKKRKLSSNYNKITDILNNVSSKGSKSALSQIVVDKPGTFILPISITKNSELLQRENFGAQLRRLPKTSEPLARRPRGEVLWFRGPSVIIQERLINSNDDCYDIPLNRWFHKKRKFEYEEFEEEVESETEQNSKPIGCTRHNQNIKKDAQALENDELEDTENESRSLSGTFPLGLRPSAKFISYKLSSFNN
ncbi:hypothetical protein TBLA_0D02040 [Henningerozyma blattae CBS 6284]|uniref:BAH domain-containing protein n=1 Tax=Henningerozyma blattae (strain ATCC 34711 / CBS 6284 / DSM 70876 / NBRC 10599 / NRRL Y-10934 / UCD 77-7) TaxID=1071380 RepID=I2H2V9_HENB6|nr:hypothetical protein TBLA_0D02040 [Tetrapisispora blattae CBS 6284]CCH60711.1 hypothetical protein TBLA_0D02040 [Tetrapisispora blattae CBS 6284]